MYTDGQIINGHRFNAALNRWDPVTAPAAPPPPAAPVAAPAAPPAAAVGAPAYTPTTGAPGVPPPSDVASLNLPAGLSTVRLGDSYPYLEFADAEGTGPRAANYVGKILSFRDVRGQDGLYYLLEVEIVASDNPALPAGARAKWMRKAGGKFGDQYLVRDLVRIVMAILGLYMDRASDNAAIQKLTAEPPAGVHPTQFEGHYQWHLTRLFAGVNGPGEAAGRLIKVLSSPAKVPYKPDTRNPGVNIRVTNTAFFPAE